MTSEQYPEPGEDSAVELGLRYAVEIVGTPRSAESFRVAADAVKGTGTVVTEYRGEVTEEMIQRFMAAILDARHTTGGEEAPEDMEILEETRLAVDTALRVGGSVFEIITRDEKQLHDLHRRVIEQDIPLK